jgi:ElaB/YqjD/DUF883 family membrane-anchored ribosome-binding protein
MTMDPRLAAAEAEVSATRARMVSTLGEIQERLKPSTLAHDAMETAAQSVASAGKRVADTARSRPLVAGAVAGAIGLFFARRPIMSLLRRDETGASPEGLNSQG